MFALCCVTTISLVGLIWFRSFEEDLFVLLNPEQEKQDKFYAEREKRTPLVYATISEAVVNLRATLYDALGFFDDYGTKEVKIEEEYKGEINELPLSRER